MLLTSRQIKLPPHPQSCYGELINERYVIHFSGAIIQTIQWNNFTIQTDFHPAQPLSSEPGLAPAYNQWNPQNVQVVNGNLLLSLQRNSIVSWQGQPVWAAAEAVVLSALNYGVYCCSFKVTDGNGNLAWSQFDTTTASPNITTTFGIFIYDASATSAPNPYSGIDLLELGFQNQPNNGSGWIGQQPDGPILNNAQFALQPWDAAQANQPDWKMVKRINLDIQSLPASGIVTVFCNWQGANQPVTYYLAYGAFQVSDIGNLPAGTLQYTTPAAANVYVPTLNPNIQLHLNLWPYGGPSTNSSVFVEITNLEIP